MAKKVLNNLDTMGVARGNINDNFTELYDPSSGNMYNTVEITAVLAVAGTYYSLESADLDSDNLKDFTFSDGVFTYTGASGKKFLFNGAANISVDKACELTFGLYINTTLVTGGTTPVDITSQNKKANIGIATIVTLNNGDEVRVKAKSDTATTELVVGGINTVLWANN